MAEPIQKNIVVYTTDTWPWCHRTKEYLSRKGVQFTEHNVSQDREKAMEMVQKSRQMGVPVIIVDDEVVVGFNQPRLEQLLSA